jgi:hypothetical protein
MIAYGRLIDSWVEISTLSETNNAQFFSEPAMIQALPESMQQNQQPSRSPCVLNRGKHQCVDELVEIHLA